VIIFDFSVGLKQVKIKRRSLFLIFKKGDKMNELDYVILDILAKRKKISKDVLNLISVMNNKEKIKLIRYLYIMLFKYSIIPSDNRIRKEIFKITYKNRSGYMSDE
jgi:hypothetical protein